tara:strand:- start:749 stop:1072 length:324 start_codon:yes stop_codon:yes gene_type:complete
MPRTEKQAKINEAKYQIEHNLYMIEIDKKNKERIKQDKIKRLDDYVARQFKYLRATYNTAEGISSDYKIRLDAYLAKDKKNTIAKFDKALDKIFRTEYKIALKNRKY